MNTKRSPTKNGYYNSMSAKKDICEIRKLFNKSCRNCVYFDTCKEKRRLDYEDYKLKLQRWN